MLDEAVVRAIANGDIVLHYQPIVDFASRAPVGCEALARWFDQGELRPPLTWIPYLRDETKELLTQYLVQVVIAQLQTCPGWIAINLPSSCANAEFFGKLDKMVPPALKPRLVLELTEEVAFDQCEIVVLLSMGFTLSLDDWGTGYSNLSALINYPYKYLKIDSTLTAGIVFSPLHAKVCRFALAVANEIGAITIGEGVETQSQAEWLWLNGCQLGQGWYLGRPAPACTGDRGCLAGEA